MTRDIPIDPFSLKQIPKWNPKRLFPTLRFRFNDWQGRFFFENYKLPYIGLPATAIAMRTEEFKQKDDTDVTEKQAHILGECLLLTEHLQEPIIEVGSYHGITTSFMARNTKRMVVAIDPFSGWGGCESDYKKFLSNTSRLQSIKHIRMTSGEAERQVLRTSFVFIDAVHDYGNVIFDLSCYARKVVSKGVIALHDTDNIAYPGTRLAVFKFLKRACNEFHLLFHVHDLTVIRRNSG